MAKPICVIYLPENYSFGNEERNAPMLLMQALNGNFGDNNGEGKIKYTDYWKDYYWFSFTKHGIDEPEFITYYEKDFNEVTFEELKKIILDSINKK